jgi:hypothetical protein
MEGVLDTIMVNDHALNIIPAAYVGPQHPVDESLNYAVYNTFKVCS